MGAALWMHEPGPVTNFFGEKNSDVLIFFFNFPGTMLTPSWILLPVLVVAWWCSAGTCMAIELQVQAALFRRAPGAGGWGIGCERASRRIIAPGTRRATGSGLAGHMQWQMMDRRTVAARAGLLAGAALCGADPVLADATARRPPPAARLAGRLDQVRVTAFRQFSLDASSRFSLN